MQPNAKLIFFGSVSYNFTSKPEILIRFFFLRVLKLFQWGMLHFRGEGVSKACLGHTLEPRSQEACPSGNASRRCRPPARGSEGAEVGWGWPAAHRAATGYVRRPGLHLSHGAGAAFVHDAPLRATWSLGQLAFGDSLQSSADRCGLQRCAAVRSPRYCTGPPARSCSGS